MSPCDQTLDIEPNSLYEVSFLYRDDSDIPINLTGLVDNADFTIHQGATTIWTGSMNPASGVTPILAQGRFDVLIPDTITALFAFSRVKYRFRIRWISKGWQSLADGVVTLDG